MPKIKKPDEILAKAQNQRRGPLSREEKLYIENTSKYKTTKEIAKHLRRNPRSIKDYILEKGLEAADELLIHKEEVEILDKLHKSEWWPTTEKQFSKEELVFFERFWCRLYKQFDADVLASEEIQIRKFITLEVLKDRCLREVKSSQSEIELLEDEYTSMLQLDSKDRDRELVRSLREEISTRKASLPSLNSQFRELSQEQQKIQKDLSASRNDRVKNIQDASQNWSTIVKLLEDGELRRKVGKHIELMKYAFEKEMRRLTEMHKFVDGEYDRPILSGQLEEFSNESSD